MEADVKVGDRVMIRRDYLPRVKCYQNKMLEFRRLVGVVKKVTKQIVVVDFSQYDLPPRELGQRYGSKVKVNKTFVKDDLPAGHFPPEFLEVVKVSELA